MRVSEHALLVDNECRTLQAAFLSLSFYFAIKHHAVRLTCFRIGIRKQTHTETVFVAESTMCKAVVPAYTDHYCIKAGEFILKLAEVDCFHGATGRVVFRIKIQDDVPHPPEIRKANQVHIRVRKFERGRCLTDLEHANDPSTVLCRF